MGLFVFKNMIRSIPVKAVFIICASILIWNQALAATYVDPVYPPDPFRNWALSEKEIAENDFFFYFKKLQDIDSMKRSLKTQEDWINLKMERLIKRNADIPFELTDAVERIHVKMDKNDMESAKVSNLMKDSANRVLEILDKVLKRYNGRKPEWWVFHPELARYLNIESEMEMAKDDTVHLKGVPDYIIEKSKESVFPEEGEPYQVTEASSEMIKELNDKLIKGGVMNWLEFQTTKAGIQLVNTRPILFETAKADVGREYLDFLSKLAVILKPYEIIAYIKGYADSRPINTEVYPTNWELAAHRAANVSHILIDRGLAPSKFRVISRGHYGTPRPNDTSDNMQENRSVKMIVRFKSLPVKMD